MEMYFAECYKDKHYAKMAKANEKRDDEAHA